ncbi:MAG: transcriptional regulator [Acidobacteriaceae bacterium]|nr:transcriptional regulator [Acidobacteriaceae bacterium]
MPETAIEPPSPATHTDRFRRFNRMYTRFIGTLDEGLLNTEYSLAEARVLYELATRTQPNAKEIAAALGMDTGYLSRVLSKFQAAGLLRRTASKHDTRSSELALTLRGRSAFTKLDTLSTQQAHTILSALSPEDQASLIHAMQTIESVLATDPHERQPYILRPHRPGDMGWVVHREAAVYAEEYGWDNTFEALVARIVADFITHFDPVRERCWIAESTGQSIGHIFLVKHPDNPETAKLRLLLVESSARGMGLGHVLVNECIRFARTAGYRRITLWTQSILVPAHRIYEKAGFRLVKEEPHHSFGKDLVGQTWELDVSPGK